MSTYTQSLTRLEYFGLETLFKKLIVEYESTISGIHTTTNLVRTQNGVAVCNNLHFYFFGSFAAKELIKIGDTCALTGFLSHGEPICSQESDCMVDVSEYLTLENIPIDDLMDKIQTLC